MIGNIQHVDRYHNRLSSHLFDSGTELLGNAAIPKPELLNSTGVGRSSRPREYAESRAINRSTTIEQPLPLESELTDYSALLSDWELVWLEAATIRQDFEAFANLWKQIEWTARRPTQIASAVRLAISAEAPALARELSMIGSELYPHDAELKALSRITASPIVTTRREPPRSDIRADRDWVRTHRQDYRGQWVALRNGELLAAAETAEALIRRVGDVRNSGMLITQIW